MLANNAGMKITDLPTAELLRLIQATERSSDPDQYAAYVCFGLSYRVGLMRPFRPAAIAYDPRGPRRDCLCPPRRSPRPF